MASSCVELQHRPLAAEILVNGKRAAIAAQRQPVKEFGRAKNCGMVEVAL